MRGIGIIWLHPGEAYIGYIVQEENLSRVRGMVYTKDMKPEMFLRWFDDRFKQYCKEKNINTNDVPYVKYKAIQKFWEDNYPLLTVDVRKPTLFLRLYPCF